MNQTQTADAATTPRARLARVRRATTANVFMLIIQFILGIIYNLYGTAPTSTKSIGWFSNGWLALHVVLGILLLLAGIGLVVQAMRASNGLAKAMSWVGLAGIVGAFAAGSSFTHDGSNGASLGMSLAFAVALACYVVMLIRLPAGES
jgi:cation transport ATPase